MRRPNSLDKIVMLRKTEGRQRGGAAEDEMVGWHHQLNGHESEESPGDCGGQRSVACCSPWVAQSQTPLSNWTTKNLWSQNSYVEKHFAQLSKLYNKNYFKNTEENLQKKMATGRRGRSQRAQLRQGELTSWHSMALRFKDAPLPHCFLLKVTSLGQAIQ